MADEGATFYYVSKQFFNFKKTCDFLEKAGLHIRHPDTQLITGINRNGDFVETKQENIQKMIYDDKNSGVYLHLDSGHRIFWSFVETNNYFVINFTFNYLEYIQIEKEISNIFIRLSLKEISENNNFLYFTLDQFGQTDYCNFDNIFDLKNDEKLNKECISDITFLPEDKISKIALDHDSEIIHLNQSFDCIAKNSDLADYVKSLL